MRHVSPQGMCRQVGKALGVVGAVDGTLEEVQPPRRHVRQLFAVVGWFWGECGSGWVG